MLFGPDAIVGCPHCGALARHWTLESGNDFGSTQWTDGKQFAPMLQLPPEFVRCRRCRGFHRREDAKPVGALPGPFYDEEPGDEAKAPPEWLAAPFLEEPTEAEYFEAIDAGLGDAEIDARILAWWRGNDPFRGKTYAKRFGGGNDDRTATPEARARNLEAILDKLDEATPGALVIKAEALRQLGRFDDALVILHLADEDERVAWITPILRQYCEAGDSQLHALGPEPPDEDDEGEHDLFAQFGA